MSAQRERAQGREWPADPLGAAVLPVLMHGLNNATQLLSALNAIVSSGGGDEWLAQRSGDLAHAGETVERLGYVLAVLSSAAGADLLLERRRPDGIGLVLSAVGDALRRDGRALAELEREVPRLDPRAGSGWELPWAVGAVAYVAGGAASGALRVELRAPHEAGLTVVVPGVAAAALRELEPALRARLAEVELDERSDEVLVQLAVPLR